MGDRRPGLLLLLLLGALVLLGSCGGGGDDRPTVLLVTVDTLRADRLGAYGSVANLTPHLDALAGESLVFDRAYAPASFTYASVSSLLTGLYPEEAGIDANRSVLSADVPTLGTLLRDEGWVTAAVVSNFVLRRACGLAEGFDYYDDEFPQSERTRRHPERVANYTTDAALSLVDRIVEERPGEPLFLWVHFQDPHGPYRPPKGFRKRYLPFEQAKSDGGRQLAVGTDHRGLGDIPKYQFLNQRRDPAFYRAGYNGEVEFTDDMIRRLMGALGKRGLLDDDSVVVFASDHGEGLGEEEYWFAHSEFLTEPLVRVPVMIRAPGIAPGRWEEPVGLIDLLPTLLEHLGVARPERVTGQDVLNGDRSPRPFYLSTLTESTIPRKGLVYGNLKLLVTKQLVGEERVLVDLDTNRVIGRENPDLVEEMVGRLESIEAELERTETVRQKLSPEEEKRLEELGYVDDKE